MKENTKFFPTPGIGYEISRFKDLLKISPSAHLLVRGSRGVGKSYFLQVFKEPNPGKETKTLNCATIPKDLASSELFSYKRGAFTGAMEDTPGFIYAAQKDNALLILEEFNSLSREDQAKLLVFMETSEFYAVGSRKVEKAAVGIVATANHETEQENGCH